MERVARLIVASQLVLRRADAEDCRNLFRWRNEEVTRGYSGDGQPLSWETHRQWFDDVLGRGDRLLVIGERDGHPVGVLRFDLDGRQATISVYLVPGNQGSGLGTALIEAEMRYLAQHTPEIAEIIARVSVHNRASIGAFEGAGYIINSFQFKRMLKVSNENR